MQALRRVLTVGNSSNQTLRVLLLLLALLFIAIGDASHLLFRYPFSVDLEIPLQAAQRWVDGGEPYQASSFVNTPGSTAPFLYPPYFLVLIRPLLWLPHVTVQIAWLAICLACSVYFVRRLAFPAWSWLLVLAWPPFLEPIIGGNVQLVFIACFAWIFWQSSPAGPLRPVDRDIADPAEPGTGIGLVASLISWMKVSQPHTWLYVLRRRPVDALIGAAVVTVVAAATIPITGIGLWTDWLVQLRRAADPAWDVGGIAVARLVSPWLGFTVVMASFVAILLLCRRVERAPGSASSPSSERRHSTRSERCSSSRRCSSSGESSRWLPQFLIATTTYEGTWAGILIVLAAMVAGLRWPALLEPDVSQPSPAALRALGTLEAPVGSV